MNSKKFKIIAYSLTLAGAIPFVLCIVGIFTHLVQKNILAHSLIAYAAVILTFLGGIHWGEALCYKEKTFSQWLLIESIFPALIAWLILLLPIIYWQLIILCTMFFGVLLTDILLYRKAIIENWFLKLRIIISTLVLILLLISFVIFST